MKAYWFIAAALLVACAGTWPVAAQVQSPTVTRELHGAQDDHAARDVPSARDVGREVLGVFSAMCASCHGPELRKPKGRFGYVLDLKRLAEDTEKVIPSKPDESDLWVLVRRNEMPPADAPHGSLTKEQKEIIRKWIAAGAPDVLPAAAAEPAQEPPAISSESASEPAEFSAMSRFFLWLGKFHLLLLHFPIALVVAAGFAEVLSVLQRKPNPSESVRFCLLLAALAAAPTAALGWLFAAAGNGAGSPELLTAHRWLGTVAAICLVITAIAIERDARRGRRSNLARLLLALCVFLTTIAAHLGGLLDRGADFFNY